MTTHSPNHLKPGQIVQHPDAGYGIAANHVEGLSILYVSPSLRVQTRTYDLAGWEPVETLPAGHVAIRTDDLDLNHPEGIRALWLRVQRLATDPVVYESYEEWAAANNSRCTNVVKPGHVQVRVDDLSERVGAHSILETRAWTAWLDWAEQQAKSHNEPATSEIVTDSEAPNFTTTVSLPCPDCGEAITREAKVWSAPDSGRVLAWATSRPDADWHTCAPVEPVRLMHPEPMEFGAKASYIDWHTGRRIRLIRTGDDSYPWINENGIPWGWDELTHADGKNITLLIGWGDKREPFTEPDEPQEFGARVTVTRPDGTREPWLRVDTYTKRPWLSEAAGFDRSWNQVKQRGAVTLGWGDGQ